MQISSGPVTPFDTLRIASQSVTALAGGNERQVIARAMRIGLWTWPAFVVLDAYMCFVVFPGTAFTPFILPIVAVSILFTILMNPVWGVFNAVLNAAGLPSNRWLTDPATAMDAAVLMIIWKYAGYYMILFLTALLAVPQEYYDAAHIDGAGPLQTFIYITVPSILPAFVFISVINVIGNLQVFAPIFVMTQGGPNRATEVVAHVTGEDQVLAAFPVGDPRGLDAPN